MSNDVHVLAPSALLAMTAEIVSAHAGANPMDAAALPALIQEVYRALANVGAISGPVAARKEPAVPIKRSVFPDYLVCLEDGQQVKALKRYIQTRYGLTPAQYREKWGLPKDYPMVAPAYSAHRSTLAKQFGLGWEKAAEVEVKRIPEGKSGVRQGKVPERDGTE